jgi:hypothetical protein
MDVDIIHLDEEEIMKNIRDNTTEACNNSNENRTNDENRIFDNNNNTGNDNVKDSDNDSSNLPPMQAFIENNLELGLYQQLSELEDKWLGWEKEDYEKTGILPEENHHDIVPRRRQKDAKIEQELIKKIEEFRLSESPGDTGSNQKRDLDTLYDDDNSNEDED